jgi:hypothetical protein
MPERMPIKKWRRDAEEVGILERTPERDILEEVGIYLLPTLFLFQNRLSLIKIVARV